MPTVDLAHILRKNLSDITIPKIIFFLKFLPLIRTKKIYIIVYNKQSDLNTIHRNFDFKKKYKKNRIKYRNSVNVYKIQKT